jgi:hypothetical protein
MPGLTGERHKIGNRLGFRSQRAQEQSQGEGDGTPLEFKATGMIH